MKLIDFESKYLEATRKQVHMVNSVDEIVKDSTVRTVDTISQDKIAKRLENRKVAISDMFKDLRVDDLALEKIARLAKLSEKWDSRLPDMFQAATRVHDDYFEILKDLKRTHDKKTCDLIFMKVGVSQHVLKMIEEQDVSSTSSQQAGMTKFGQ